MTTVVRYLVTVSTPQGVAELEVPSTLGAGAAGRRGKWCAVGAGWGDVDDVRVVSVSAIDDNEALPGHDGG